MGRFRIFVAALLAVAVMSVGAAACTPEQQVQAGTGIGNLITAVLFIWAESFAPAR